MSNPLAKWKKDANTLIQQVLEEVHPRKLIPKVIRIEGQTLYARARIYDLNSFSKVFVLDAGKAAASMAESVLDLLPKKAESVAVVVPAVSESDLERIKTFSGGHPIPDESSLQSTREIIKILKSAGEKDLVIWLTSGGASSLLEALPEQISLAAYQSKIRDRLLGGTSISELNQFRSKVSLVKGGKLLNFAPLSTWITLVLSDVVGNELSIIGSGPTFDLKLPVKSDHVLIGDNESAQCALHEAARRLNYHPVRIKEAIERNIVEEAKRFSKRVKDHLSNRNEKPICLFAGGEATVTVTGKGRGGRNQEFVLRVLMEMKDISRNFLIASIGTDGVDGPTSAAGALGWGGLLIDARNKGLDPDRFLLRNDSYTFFNKMGALIEAGATGTNVSDIAFALIESN